MLVFAAETSCDETSICLMENRSIIEHITFSQEIHKIHGGVVPELASRSHLEKIQIMTSELFSRKNIVKSFDIVLTEYVEEELDDEPEDWNPYEVDPEDYSGYDGDVEE